MNKWMLAAVLAIVAGVSMMASPYVMLYVVPIFQEEHAPTGITATEAQTEVKTQVAKDRGGRSLVWEIPPDTKDVVVEIYNADNSYDTQYTITNYITLRSGQKIKVIAR
jgi:hypothetical protein